MPRAPLIGEIFSLLIRITTFVQNPTYLTIFKINRFKNMSFITIYITNESEAEAERIATHLVSKKMIACANIYPIKSIYSWKGVIHKDTEWVALIKTKEERWEEIKSELEEIHPYEVPCIMRTKVEANKSYEEWIHRSIST